MELRELVVAVVTSSLLLGLLAVGVGLLSWILSVMAQFDMPWQAQLIAAGLVVIVMAAGAAKVFSRE